MISAVATLAATWWLARKVFGTWIAWLSVVPFASLSALLWGAYDIASTGPVSALTTLAMALMLPFWPGLESTTTSGRTPSARSESKKVVWLSAAACGAAATVVFFALSQFGTAGRGPVPTRWSPNREVVLWPVMGLAAWGLWTLWRLSPRVATWWLSFPVGCSLLVSKASGDHRQATPFLPFVAVLAALAARDGMARVKRRRGTRASVETVKVSANGRTR